MFGIDRKYLTIILLLASIFISLILGSYQFLVSNKPATLPSIKENLEMSKDAEGNATVKINKDDMEKAKSVASNVLAGIQKGISSTTV